MTLLRASSLLALSAVVLAACSQKPSGAASSGAPASGAAASASSAPAGQDTLGPEIPASEIPPIRAGYWQVTDTMSGGRPHVSKTCEGGKSQSMHMGKECTHLSLHRTLLGNFVMDAQCSAEQMSVAMHIEAKGDFQNHYTVDSVTQMKIGKDQPERTVTSHSEAVYLGPCPAGVTPIN